MISAVADEVKIVFTYKSFDWDLNMACHYGHGTLYYENVIESNITFPRSILNLAAEHKVINFLTVGTALPDELNMYSF